MAIEVVVILRLGVEHQHLVGINRDVVRNIRQVVQIEIHPVDTPVTLRIEELHAIGIDMIILNA